MTATVNWRVVPIQSWPGEMTEYREEHRFRRKSGYWDDGSRHMVAGVDWPATTALLDRELDFLEADNVVLQMAVTDREIRRDGWIRSNAVPDHPGVILTFDSWLGPLSYPCDNFTAWKANVRAIALALEALRKIDRYGVTKRGEQYTGWKQIPGPGQTSVTMTANRAAEILKASAGESIEGKFPEDVILGDAGVAQAVHKAARRSSHPDAGGSDERFQSVELAWSVLSAHFNGARGEHPEASR